MTSEDDGSHDVHWVSFTHGLAEEQCMDPFLGAILQFLENKTLLEDNQLAQHVRIKAEQCEILDGLLHHHVWPQWGTPSMWMMVWLAVPPGRVEAVMWVHHDNLLGGHLGK